MAPLARVYIVSDKSRFTKMEFFKVNLKCFFTEAILFPNSFYILLSNTNTLPKTAFRNLKNLGFYATLKYAKVAPEIVSAASL